MKEAPDVSDDHEQVDLPLLQAEARIQAVESAWAETETDRRALLARIEAIEATKLWRWSRAPRSLYASLRSRLMPPPEFESVRDNGRSEAVDVVPAEHDWVDLTKAPSSQLRDYLVAVDSVPGWFSTIDLLLFTEINRLQGVHAIRGDLFEIGAYCGKSAILLGYFVREGERLTVCDLFGQDLPVSDEVARENTRWYRGFVRSDFEHHYRRFHADLPEILQQLSTEIDVSGRYNSCRIIHIDGSHVYAVVKQDIATARSLMAPGGILIMDDISTPHAPGSALAAWEAVLDGTIVPMCLSEAKLYATFGPQHIPLDQELEDWATPRKDLVVEHHELAGHRVLRIRPAD